MASVSSALSWSRHPGLARHRWRHGGALFAVLVSSRLKQWTRGRLLGFWWWLLEPLAMTCTYLVLVRYAFRYQAPHAALFLMCAVLPWSWFVAATGDGLQSLVRNAGLLKTMRLRYALFPATDVAATSIRFVASLVVLLLLMAIYQVSPTWQLFWLPVLVLVQFVFTLGVAWWLSLAQVFVEDSAHMWKVATRIWFFLSPSIYAMESLPAAVRPWMLLNPFAAVFTSYRAVVMHGAAPPIAALALLAVVGTVLACSGWWILNRTEGVATLHL